MPLSSLTFALEKLNKEIWYYVPIENQNKVLENLGDGWGDKQAVSKLVEHEIGKNNTNCFECCKVFSIFTNG